MTETAAVGVSSHTDIPLLVRDLKIIGGFSEWGLARKNI